MKGYKNAQIIQVEDDLKRCRELSMEILKVDNKITELVETYTHLHNKDLITGSAADWVQPYREQMQELEKQRDEIINKYFTSISKLKQRERDIILLYYIDNVCIKLIAHQIKIEERQVVYSKKKALEKLAGF